MARLVRSLPRDALAFAVQQHPSLLVQRVVAQGAVDARAVDLGGDQIHACPGMRAAAVDVGLLAALDARHDLGDHVVAVEDRQRVAQQDFFAGAGSVGDRQIVLAFELAGQPLRRLVFAACGLLARGPDLAHDALVSVRVDGHILRIRRNFRYTSVVVFSAVCEFGIKTATGFPWPSLFECALHTCIGRAAKQQRLEKQTATGTCVRGRGDAMLDCEVDQHHRRPEAHAFN